MSVVADPIPSPAGTGPDISRGSELCTQCGLCCTGALHNAAVLDPDEVAAATEIGLPVCGDSEKPLFSLPCPKLVGACCSIYGNRPRVCGRYRCQILQDLEAGETSFDEATKKVAIARTLVEQARSVMPPGMTLPQIRKLSAEPAPTGLEGMPADVRDLEMRRRLAATALTLYIDRHFRNSRDGQMLALNPVDGTIEMEAG